MKDRITIRPKGLLDIINLFLGKWYFVYYAECANAITYSIVLSDFYCSNCLITYVVIPETCEYSTIVKTMSQQDLIKINKSMCIGLGVRNCS